VSWKEANDDGELTGDDAKQPDPPERGRRHGSRGVGGECAMTHLEAHDALERLLRARPGATETGAG
jgi:hypothetical protein